MIKSFRDLEVYQESFQLQIEVEDELKNYPRQEQYLLTDQTRRSCRPIPKLGGKMNNLKNNWQVFKTSKNPTSNSNV